MAKKRFLWLVLVLVLAWAWARPPAVWAATVVCEECDQNCTGECTGCPDDDYYRACVGCSGDKDECKCENDWECVEKGYYQGCASESCHGDPYTVCASAVCQGNLCVLDHGSCRNYFDVHCPTDPCSGGGTLPTPTPCPGTWGSWGSCSNSCGDGSQTRTCNCPSGCTSYSGCTSPSASCNGTDSQDCCSCSSSCSCNASCSSPYCGGGANGWRCAGSTCQKSCSISCPDWRSGHVNNPANSDDPDLTVTHDLPLTLAGWACDKNVSGGDGVRRIDVYEGSDMLFSLSQNANRSDTGRLFFWWLSCTIESTRSRGSGGSRDRERDEGGRKAEESTRSPGQGVRARLLSRSG